MGLLAAARKRYRHYSLGMKQRLGIAASLLAPRQLIVLDEPTNGLDPQGTREVRALIRQIAAAGVTVFVSSHLGRADLLARRRHAGRPAGVPGAA
ncbi:MAG: AAA family ATPase [Streptosporangiaceae bacterium]